ncbi:hypothetical protein FWH58_00845 [Candidatus Saccharibacteria bacterium]|nr:hypothetical protein [Candidatus Saccharibacteria bacterium]
MKHFVQLVKQHRTLVIASIGFVVMVGLVAWSWWPNVQPIEEDVPPVIAAIQTTTIDSGEALVENLPDSEWTLIETVLYGVVQANLGGQTTPTTGAVIREGSYQQTLHDPGKQIFFTSFMVDIPTIKQSYHVEYYFSPLPNELAGLGGDYNLLILCPTADELIYETFLCTDRMKQEQGR